MTIRTWLEDNIQELYGQRTVDAGPVVWAVPETAFQALLQTHMVVPRKPLAPAIQAARETCNVAVDGKVLVNVEHWNAIIAAFNTMIEDSEEEEA